MPEYRPREVPWLPVVRFHKEVVTRAEEGFFSLNGSDDQAERWTSLPGFDPSDPAGPWRIGASSMRSHPFRLSMEQGQHQSLFLGGPCFVRWSKSMAGSWVAQWRPLLYREVELRATGSQFDVVPKAGCWSVTPLLYNVLDRLESSASDSLDVLAARLIERSASYDKADSPLLEQRIRRALFSLIPDVESQLSKPIRAEFPVPPSPWVLFAPASDFSALTRHLMRDYERLDAILTKDPKRVGGLRLLEDRPASPAEDKPEVLPLVPLNESQREAVQRMLGKRPLTVISGPPGTGKSQVVVSLLLNAWAHGKTVLFASNNNKAVDVVRDRVERFESEFPIAVRAGARQKQNIQEVLRRTLNMVGTNDESPTARTELSAHRQRRDSLLREKRELQDALDSTLPQRIDESKSTALKAYGEYRTTVASISALECELQAKKVELGFGSTGIEDLELAVKETLGWLQRIDQFESLIRQDTERRQGLQSGIVNHERLRDRAVVDAGLDPTSVADWDWLRTGPHPDTLSDWDERMRAVLDRPIELDLEAVEWRVEFDRWRGAEDADKWAKHAREFADALAQGCAELAPKLEEVRTVSAAVDAARSRLRPLGIPEDVDLPGDHIHGWMACFAEYATIERGRLDFLPWSARSRLRRRLLQHERLLRPGLPLELWTRIGALNDVGRGQLAPILEVTRQWIALREVWQSTQELVAGIEARFRTFRSQAASLRLRDVPTSQCMDAWTRIVDLCEKTALLADAAAQAWRRRVRKESAEHQLRLVAKEWSRVGNGVPIREAWRSGHGALLDGAMRALAEAPASETVLSARAALFTAGPIRLIECWRAARAHEEASSELRTQLRSVAEPKERIRDWWRERPGNSFVLETPSPDWPDAKAARARVDAVSDFCERWRVFDSKTKPGLAKKAQGELTWALGHLDSAVKALPKGKKRTQIATIVDRIKAGPDCEWPVAELHAAVGEFGPERIRARIERIEAELEQKSFEDAKAQWLERLRTDDDAIRAVDRLEKSLQRNKGIVVEEEHDTFRAALRAVPIWITTAQASQAIPLEPELFDIVVIDEASQCTLTNLLPLMFRGRSLAVIGDENQLTAIPIIREAEELALARKHGVEEHLEIVGHATNNVYKTATESLPRRRADVLMLSEHFRSHPQIIGFSNRHIYLQRLELKKDPNWGNRLPVGSGVHMVSVAGTCSRGSKGRSWVNVPEVSRVLELVKQLKQGDSRSLSLGIVTPFAAQKERIREGLEALNLTVDVLADTANGFQGDERDIIIFSPVVAKGITSSASSWVEKPPNLINVAITRAREALFVVGDIDYCLQQEGILRKLGLYCRDIQLLRDTSPAELELFSWMVVKGWEPKVHPRIGDIEVDFTLRTVAGGGIAIEVDGRQHAESVELDRARDAYLQGQGYAVQRVSAREVLETPSRVVHALDQLVGGIEDAAG